MSKLRTVIVCGVFVLLATVIMCNMYIFANISYAYTPSDTISPSKIAINGIDVINKVDSYRVDGPNVVGSDINLDIDLYPNEIYKFKYDIVNKTDINYLLSKVNIGCLNEPKINDYLTIDMKYEDGTPVNDNDEINDGVKRTIYVTIAYNKKQAGLKTFNLNFDMDFNIISSR